MSAHPTQIAPPFWYFKITEEDEEGGPPANEPPPRASALNYLFGKPEKPSDGPSEDDVE